MSAQILGAAQTAASPELVIETGLGPEYQPRLAKLWFDHTEVFVSSEIVTASEKRWTAFTMRQHTNRGLSYGNKLVIVGNHPDLQMQKSGQDLQLCHLILNVVIDIKF